MTLIESARTTVSHPLSRLTAEEITAATAIVREAGLVHESSKFVYVGLEEPHRRDVLAWTPGDPIERRVRVLLLDRATGDGRDLTVSTTGGAVVTDVEIDGVADGQVPILDAELREVRRRGCAVQAGQVHDDLACAAVPVRSPAGVLVAALVVTVRSTDPAAPGAHTAPAREYAGRLGRLLG